MASRRWVITTPPPKTAKCPHCLRLRNVLSIYPTPNGKLCFTCLTSPYLTARAPETLVLPAAVVAPVAIGPVARPTVCPEPGCGRLPAHKGDHRATLLRRPKPAAVTYTYGV